MSAQYLTLEAAGKDLAIRVLDVREILQYEAVTPVPHALPWIRGVMNLRGNVVPVLDLAVRLGGGPATPTRRTCVVIVEWAQADGPLTVGLLADSVSEVIDVAPADFDAPPDFGMSVRRGCVEALARVGPKLLVVLNLDGVLGGGDGAAA